MSSQARSQHGTPRRVNRRLAAERAARRRRQLFGLGGAVAVALVAVIILIALNRPGSEGDSLPAVAAAAAAYDGVAIDGRALGDPKAPVTVVEFGDYQCPGCGAFARDTEPQWIQEYVRTGKVRFEYHDDAFIGQESTAAAEAAACAVDQGKFWPFHATLFANQHGENQGAFTKARLREAARLVGLDLTAFNQCVDRRAHKDDVAAMTAEAGRLGVAVTPSFVVNGRLMRYGGYDALKAAVDAALPRP